MSLLGEFCNRGQAAMSEDEFAAWAQAEWRDALISTEGALSSPETGHEIGWKLGVVAAETEDPAKAAAAFLEIINNEPAYEGLPVISGGVGARLLAGIIDGLTWEAYP